MIYILIVKIKHKSVENCNKTVMKKDKSLVDTLYKGKNSLKPDISRA